MISKRYTGITESSLEDTTTCFPSQFHAEQEIWDL